MFTSFFKRKSRKVDSSGKALAMYISAMARTREPAFYEKYGVPDTFDGRFDLLLVHLFIIMHVLMKGQDYKDISQELFDVTFRNMDQTLREAGIGDVGVPKHMRRMMEAFNGRLHAYQVSIEPETLKTVEAYGVKPSTLRESLRRNLYGTVPEVSEGQIGAMESYVLRNLNELKIDDRGVVTFAEVSG